MVVWSWVVSCVHCVKVHTVHTAYDPAPHNCSQHNQCRTPYAVIPGLVLLMMGIMMPETCWDRSLIIKIRLVASCWFISLHPQQINVYALSALLLRNMFWDQKFCYSVIWIEDYVLATAVPTCRTLVLLPPNNHGTYIWSVHIFTKFSETCCKISIPPPQNALYFIVLFLSFPFFFFFVHKIFKFYEYYFYWTVHHLDSWIERPTWCHLLFYFII